jgi:hypothetical protein
LIDKYGPPFATVAVQISLSVTVYIKPAHHARALNWDFPNGGMHRLALPGDIARQADID